MLGKSNLKDVMLSPPLPFPKLNREEPLSEGCVGSVNPEVMDDDPDVVDEAESLLANPETVGKSFFFFVFLGTTADATAGSSADLIIESNDAGFLSFQNREEAFATDFGLDLIISVCDDCCELIFLLLV